MLSISMLLIFMAYLIVFILNSYDLLFVHSIRQSFTIIYFIYFFQRTIAISKHNFIHRKSIAHKKIFAIFTLSKTDAWKMLVEIKIYAEDGVITNRSISLFIIKLKRRENNRGLLISKKQLSKKTRGFPTCYFRTKCLLNGS